MKRSVPASLVGAAAFGIWAGTCVLPAQISQPSAYERAPRAVATVQDRRISEASGIAASRRHPGLFYVHNDSGDSPRVFLIDRRGATQAVIRLRGARAVDYEDIAVAPGETAGTFDVCVADIGDNSNNRPEVVIYRFAEPDLPEAVGKTVDVQPAAYVCRYAEGPADAEALAVHPQTGDGYIITKSVTGRAAVYKLAAPWDAQQPTVVSKPLTLDLPPALPALRIVTAADISPDGQRLAVRCYVDGWEWRLPAETSDAGFDRIFQALPVGLPLASERQGEAICYAADGQALLTISEGVSPTLWELRLATGP